MGKKHYIRNDGNGGFNVSYGLAMFMAALAFLGMVIPSAVAYGVLNNKVNNLENTWAEAGPKHLKTIDELEADISSLEDSVNGYDKDQAVNEERFKSINDNLKEIKVDVKDIKEKIGGSSP